MNIVPGNGLLSLPQRGRALATLLTLVLAIVLFAMFRSAPEPIASVSKVVIAVPMQISSTAMIVATEQGFFQKAGVEVTSQPFVLGKDALQSVLDGHADLALVADTPLMFALLGGAQISVVAGVSQGRRALAVVGRKDRGIERLEDLKGKSVGLSLGTNLTYFLDALLQVHGVPTETVRLVDLQTAEISTALLAGDIDAATLYQPYLGRLQQQMGDRIAVFYGEDIYAYRFYLTGKTSYIESHPQEIQRILKGLIAAKQSIQADPIGARKLVANAINIKDDMLATIFDPEDYMVSLDQAMLLSLDDQTRWAMKRGLVKPGPLPNYLNSVNYQNLEAVSPSAVTLVH